MSAATTARAVRPLRLLAAMSGGVDSAVAAARAAEAGHDVTGVHLALSPSPAASRNGARGCCTLEDARDARRAADVIGIPFYVWDMAERFAADVVEDFVAEYAAGRTPNPCLRCNEKIKFAAVLDRALALGFDGLVTGHHASVAGGRLERSTDRAKDQSYVLAVCTPTQLAHAHFPLGDSTKQQVRAEAARRGLGVAAKPDSHDICFIADGDTRGFLARRLGEQPGEVVDADTGAVVGEHAGTHGFTVGQRRGLRLDRPTAAGEPRYVLALRPVERQVVVGRRELLDVRLVRADRPVWGPDGRPGETFRAGVQLRAHGEVVASTVTAVVDGTLEIVADEPVRGIAAGQAAVFYDLATDTTVLGSATVAEAVPAGLAGVSAAPGSTTARLPAGPA